MSHNADDLARILCQPSAVIDELITRKLIRPDMPGDRFSNSVIDNVRRSNTLCTIMTGIRKKRKTEEGQRAAEEAEREKMREQMQHDPELQSIQAARRRLDDREKALFAKYQQPVE